MVSFRVLRRVGGDAIALDTLKNKHVSLFVAKRGVFIRCALSQKQKQKHVAFDAVAVLSKASAADTKTLTISAPRCALLSHPSQNRSHSFADIHREMMYASYTAFFILNKACRKNPFTR